MNRPRTIPTTVALLAICLTLPLLAQGESGPKAELVQPVIDFEIVPKGKVLDHTFEIRNAGTGDLKIVNVTPACGCTVVDYDRVISPGSVGKVAAKVDTSDFTGPISKTIAVKTNDPATPQIQLVVKAKVQPYVGIEPGFARYIYVQGEVMRPIAQTIWAQDGKPMTITGVKSPYDYLKVSYRKASEQERKKEVEHEGQQWVVDIELDQYAPVGPLRQYVEVTFDHPEQKSARIPISGFVRPRQFVTPDKVDFGQLQGLPLKRTLTFTNFITAGIELTKIETGIPGITGVAKAKEDTGHRFEVQLTLEEDLPKGDFSGVIRIHTTDELNPVVEVPMKGTIL